MISNCKDWNGGNLYEPFRRAGAILLVKVPATIMMSD